MEVIFVEANMEGVVSLHAGVPCHIHAVQTRSLPGAAGHHGASDSLVQEAVHRSVNTSTEGYHGLPAGLPLTFLLGFYVSLVVRRWWEQYCKLPWPDDIALSLRGVVTAGDNNKVSTSPRGSQH